jgi:hypothetical protein
MKQRKWKVGVSRTMYRKIDGKRRRVKVTKGVKGRYKVKILSKR